MTTNQTIDGVRTLAEQACGTSPDSPEYRRFIAAMNPTLLLDLTSPAAQPQGEPVAWRCVAAINGKHYITEETPDQQQKRIDNSEPGHYFFASEPLYLGPSEQPAPAAVVLPEFEPAFEKWWEEDGQYCRAGGGSYEKTFAYRAYEAALADVTRLNPSL